MKQQSNHAFIKSIKYLLKFPRILISPYFVMRFNIVLNIFRSLNNFNYKGKVLDIGCGTMPYRKLFFEYTNISQYEGIDYPEFSKNRDFNKTIPEYFFNNDYESNYQLPFEDNKYDVVVMFEVLEHHPYPEKLLSEAKRLLANDGKILLTSPFIWPLHEIPNDYQRWTEYKYKYILQTLGFKNIRIKKYGTFLSVFYSLILDRLSSLAAKGRIFYVLCSIVYIPFILLNYLVVIYDSIFNGSTIFLGYLIMAEN